MPARVASFKAMAGSPRIVGVGTAGMNLASLFNVTGSGVLVAVKRLSLQNDYTTNTGTVRVLAYSRITTAPTTGTLHTPVAVDSAQTHEPLVEFRSAASADGVASTLTATPGPRGWIQYPERIADLTSTGQLIMDDTPMIPALSENDPLILAEGEGILVANLDTPSSSQHFIVNVVWEEFLYAGSGQTWLQAIDADAPTSMWRFHTEATLVDRVDGNDGTYSGNPVNVGGAIVGDTNQATAFDGVGDTAIVPDAANLRPANLTIEGWAWIDAAAAQFDPIVMQTTSGSWNDGYGIHVETGPRLRFWINNYTIQSAAASNHIDSPVLSTGAWHHVFATFDGAQMRLVVDRVEVSGSPVALTAAIAHSTSGLRFASDPGSIFLNGRLDDWVLFPTALSVARGQAHYDAALGLGGGGGAALTGTIADTASVTDALSIVVGRNAGLADTANATDAATPATALSRTVADAANATDAASSSAGLSRGLADAATIADAAAAGLLFAATVDDAIGATDSLAASATFLRAVADVATIGDQLATAVAAVRSIADSAAIVDAAAASVAFAAALADDAGITDVASGSRVLLAALSEAAALTDDLQTQTTLLRAASDGLAASDAVERAATYAVLVDDALTAADGVAASAVLSRLVADPAAIGDALLSATAATRSIADGATIVDAASGSVFVGQLLFKTIGDSAAIADAVSRGAAYSRAVDDAVAAVDALEASAAGYRTLADSLAATDAVARASGIAQRLDDALGASDALAAAGTLVVSIDDDALLGDDATASSVVRAAIADDAAIADVLGFELAQLPPPDRILVRFDDSAVTAVAIIDLPARRLHVDDRPRRLLVVAARRYRAVSLSHEQEA